MDHGDYGHYDPPVWRRNEGGRHWESQRWMSVLIGAGFPCWEEATSVLGRQNGDWSHPEGRRGRRRRRPGESFDSSLNWDCYECANGGSIRRIG